MATEIWKDINGFEDYQISSLGRVKSFKMIPEGRLLLLTPNARGYIVVTLFKQGRRYAKEVHRLVMENFAPILDSEDKEVDHINRIKSDNRIENLRWVTPSENCRNRNNHKKIIRFPDKVIFNNIIEAAEGSESLYSHVRDCCEGTRISTNNYQFQYYQEDVDYNNIKLPKIGGKSAKQKVQNIETHIIYDSISDAARLTGIAKSNIVRCCKGERKTAGGFHWCRVEG